MASTFEVTVVERETNTVESQALEESGIRIPEERLKELRHNKVEFQGDRSPAMVMHTYLIEEIVSAFPSNRLSEGLSDLILASGIS